MSSIKSIAAALAFGIGALITGVPASQAAVLPSAAGIADQDNLVQKTHGAHRGWRRGHRHGRRFRGWRRYGGWRRRHFHRHCHYRRGGFRRCHRHRHHRRHH